MVWRTRVPPPTPTIILYLAARLGELLDDGQDRVLAAIEDRLPADADEHDVGQDLELALRVRCAR